MSSKSTDQNPQPDLAFELPTRLGTVAAAMTLADSQCLTLNQNAVFRWRYKDGKLVRSYRDHAPLTEAAITPDGKWVATASRSLKLWNAETGKAVDKIETPHVGPVHCVDFYPTTNLDGVIRFVTGGDDGVARTWDWTPGKSPKSVATFDSFRGNRINVVRFSTDGKRLMIAGDQGKAEIRMTDSGKVAWQLADPKAGGDLDYQCGDFSDDGNGVALGTSEDIALVWQLGDQPGSVQQLTRLAGHADAVQGIQMSGDSDNMYRVFTASADDSVKVWDPKMESVAAVKMAEPKIVEGRELLSLRRHSGDVNAIALSNDGRLMMTAGQDGRVILWPSKPAGKAGDAVLSK